MRKKIEHLQARKAAVIDRVYACGEPHMTFAACLSLAPQFLIAEYGALCDALDFAGCDGVAVGRAYRGAFGMLVWN